MILDCFNNAALALPHQSDEYEEGDLRIFSLSIPDLMKGRVFNYKQHA